MDISADINNSDIVTGYFIKFETEKEAQQVIDILNELVAKKEIAKKEPRWDNGMFDHHAP